MTVETQTQKVTRVGNGVARTFSFSPLVIFESTDIVVTHVVTSTGVETTLTEGTGDSAYSVSVSSYPGTGSIDYPESGGTLVPGTAKIIMKRVLTLEQTTDMENQGGYFPEVQEAQFDKLVMTDLQQQEELDRTIRLPISVTGVPATTTTPAASQYLRMNSAVDELEWATLATTSGSASDVVAVQDAIAGSAGASADYSREDHVHPDRNTKGSDITSNTSITIPTNGKYFDISGTTGPIATMTVVIHRDFILQCDSTPTFTHHATTLDLPGETDFTAAAGDILFCQATAANKVQVTNITRADGSPVVINAIDETHLKDAFIADFTEVTVAAGDSFLLGDATGSGNTKRDTVQGILDLAVAHTKEFFVPWGEATGIADTSWLADGLSSAESSAITFHIPADFTSLTSAAIMVLPDASETIQWDITTHFGASGEDESANTDSVANDTLAVTDDQIAELDITSELTGLAASDYVGLLFTSDTTIIFATGIRIKYT